MTPAEQTREAAAIARIADRIERQAKAVAAYSLFESPRKMPNFPTTVEVSLSYFTDIANELRAIPTETTEPADVARMKAALGMAKEALAIYAQEADDQDCRNPRYLGQLNTPKKFPFNTHRRARDALTAIRKVLGET